MPYIITTLRPKTSTPISATKTPRVFDTCIYQVASGDTLSQIVTKGTLYFSSAEYYYCELKDLSCSEKTLVQPDNLIVGKWIIVQDALGRCTANGGIIILP